MKRILTAVAAATFLCAGGAMAEVDSVAFSNTGVDGSGNPLASGATDLNYTVTYTGAGAPQYTGSAVAVTSAAGYPVVPNGPWLADDGFSDWISIPNGSQSAAPGVYDYTTTFNIANNLDPNTFALEGQLATDNNLVDVIVNGKTVTGISSSGFTGWTPFGLDQTDATGDFQAGLNTVTFEVNNAGSSNNPTGLRVEATATASTPEPGTLGMFGIGSALLIGMVRRSRNGKAGGRA
jgi:hypothetical protein